MSPVARQIQIRRMTAADIDRVTEIAATLNSVSAWPRTAYLDAANSAAAVPRLALVAGGASTGRQDRSGPKSPSVQGFAVASLLPPRAELEIIAVTAPMRRRGVGLLLLAALMAELRSAGVRELLLEVRASNQPAISFYCAAGFVQTGRRTRYYVNPEEDAVLMTAHLD